MPWWKSGRNPSPPSPSSSDAQGRGMSFPFNRRSPQLTRQRKLRHLRDDELRGLALEGNPVSRSQSSIERSHPRLFTSGPQPLPLPDFGAARRAAQPGGRAASTDSRDGNVPRQIDMSSITVEPIGERFVTPAVMGSRLSQHINRKSPDHFDVPLVGSNYSLQRSGLHDTSFLEDIHFRISNPERNGMASGLSSPGFSPGRLSNGDFFPGAYASAYIPQMWSAPELPPPTDFIADLAAPMERASARHDRSAHSPKGKSPESKLRNPAAPFTSLQSKICTEISPVRHDNHGNSSMHPLPLPPAPPLSLQPSFTHHVTKIETQAIPNQWQKGKLIGSGTFGNVYIATNRHTGALCAMKEVNLIPGDAKSAECIKQLQQEIKLLSQLKHPNIVQYYGSEIIEDRFYIYLEYVYPGSINKYVNEHCGAVTESVVRNFTRHILCGLQYLHGTKTMHRDIKGANLLVDSSGVVKLADFGMAKHLSGTRDAHSIKGTPYWMAPEVLQSNMNKELSYDLSIDIWSLGCTIIEMFTAKHPWSGFESAAAMFKVLQESPQIPETLSADGKDFLQLCFRRNPTERPTASQLLEHRFVTHTVQHDLQGSAQSFSGMRFSDVTHGPKNTKFAFDSTMKGKFSFSGHTGI